MYDRNDFDLRIATHAETVTHINAAGWQRQSPSRTLRTALASALTSLATRLAPAQLSDGARGQAGRKQPASA